MAGVVCYLRLRAEEQTGMGRRARCVGRARRRRLSRHRSARRVRFDGVESGGERRRERIARRRLELLFETARRRTILVGLGVDFHASECCGSSTASLPCGSKMRTKNLASTRRSTARPRILEHILPSSSNAAEVSPVGRHEDRRQGRACGTRAGPFSGSGRPSSSAAARSSSTPSRARP